MVHYQLHLIDCILSHWLHPTNKVLCHCVTSYCFLYPTAMYSIRHNTLHYDEFILPEHLHSMKLNAFHQYYHRIWNQSYVVFIYASYQWEWGTFQEGRMSFVGGVLWPWCWGTPGAWAYASFLYWSTITAFSSRQLKFNLLSAFLHWSSISVPETIVPLPCRDCTSFQNSCLPFGH